MGKAPCCDKANVKRGPWSPEEDETLKTYIHKHGTGGNWIALPKKAGLRRCGKSCRLRWLNYLRPDIRHGGFTEEEDILIYTLYSQMGSRWSIIASQLHGRTDNDVKNHWNTKLKKKLLAATKTNKNDNNNNNPNIDNNNNPILLGSTTTLTVENYINLGNFLMSLAQDFQASPTTMIVGDVNYGGATVTAQNFVHDHPTHFPSPPPILASWPQYFNANAVKSLSVSSTPSQQEASNVSGLSSVGLDEKCVSWISHGGGGGDHQDNDFFMDIGFGFSNDFTNNNGLWSLEKGSEEGAPPNLVSSLSDYVLYADIKPQGLLQSVINNTDQPY